MSKDDTLVELMAAYGLTLPRNAHVWRPAQAPGRLPALNLECDLLCTDGLLAWFALRDGTPFYGHLAAFEATKPEREVKPAKPKRPLSEKAAKRKALLDSI